MKPPYDITPGTLHHRGVQPYGCLRSYEEISSAGSSTCVGLQQGWKVRVGFGSLALAINTHNADYLVEAKRSPVDVVRVDQQGLM